MKTPIKARAPGVFYREPKGSNSWSIFSILLAIILLASCQTREKEKTGLLKLYGNGEAGNFSKNYLLYTTTCHNGKPGALMASPGDMLWLENWIIINNPSLLNRDGSIHFIQSDSLLLLNGKTAGIKLDGATRPEQLLDFNNKSDIGNLKVLSLTAAGLTLHKSVLEKIAAINPEVTLMLMDRCQNEDLKWLFGLFAPTTLTIELTEEQQALLAGEPQLERLHIANDDSIYHCTPLPALPRLSDLYFMFDGNEVASSPDNSAWLRNNPQIRNLILTDWEEAYPKGLLSALKAPEVLVMGGMDIPAEEIMAHSKTLKRVILDSGELQLELPGLNNLITFQTDEPQLFINSIPQKKPDCIALDISSTDQKLDLSPLVNLKKLESLTLIDADSINIAPLLEMKQLKLLSYSTDNTNMDSTIAVLQTALPNTVVVANDGLCLGSGWLMALVPALMAAMGLAVWRKNPNQKRA